MARTNRNKRITDRLAAHSILTATFKANGMEPDEASKAAFVAVVSMTPAKLTKFLDGELNRIAAELEAYEPALVDA